MPPPSPLNEGGGGAAGQTAVVTVFDIASAPGHSPRAQGSGTTPPHHVVASGHRAGFRHHHLAVLLLGLLGYSFFNFGVDRSRYPVSAFEFMAEENIHGRLVVTFDWAQYALAALAPTTTVGFDGRYDTCYPQAVVDMNFDLLFGSDLSRRHRGVTSGPVDSNRVLEFGNPSLVMMDRIADLPAVQFIDQHNDWTRLYSDGRAILWGRKSVFDNPQLPTYVPERRRRETDSIPAGIAAWPGFPGRRGRDAFSPVRAAEAARQRAQHSTLISRETQLLN